MRIILKYIFNNVRERKLRTAVMVFSIILSTSLLFVSMSIGDSYESAQLKMAQGFAGSATVSVLADPDTEGNPIWISEAEIPQTLFIKSRVGLLTTSALYENNGLFENFDLIAANLDELNEMNPPKLQGDTTLEDFAGWNIVTTEKFTSRYGLKPGDVVELNIGGNEYEFKLKAVAAYDTIFLRQSRGFNALIPKETLAQILQTSDGNSKIMITPTDGVSSDILIEDLMRSLPEGYRVAKTYDEGQVASEAQQKSLPFYLISFFSFVMSVFIIFSSYKVITMERLPVIGTFRSIGATKASTTRILLLESLIYGTLGGLIGIPTGFAVLKLILNSLGESLALGIPIPMVVMPFNMLIACVTAIIVSLMSAYIPVSRASRIPIKDVVLGTVDEQVTSNKVKLTAGVILLMISVVLPLSIDKENSRLLMTAGGLSLLGLIAATIIVTPLVAYVLSVLLEWVYERTFGNEGKLAARNMRNNRNVVQNITLLFISLSSVIVISSVAGFAISYLGDVYGGGTLDGFASGDISPEFVSKVENLEGIEELLPIYDLSEKVVVNDDGTVQMEAIDDLNTLCSLLNVQLIDDKNNVADVFDNNRNILMSKDYMKHHEFSIGDVIQLGYRGTSFEYQIIGAFQSRGDNSEVIIPGVYAREDFGAVNYGKIAYSAENPDAVMAQIRNLFGNQYSNS